MTGSSERSESIRVEENNSLVVCGDDENVSFLQVNYLFQQVILHHT